MNRRKRIVFVTLLVTAMPGVMVWLAKSRAAESSIRRWLPSEVSLAGIALGTELVEESSDDQVFVDSAVRYTVSDVRRWAYARSPEAGLIEAEIKAVMRGVDPKDPESCCSAMLIRDVLTEVALARRADDATHAAVAYHKLIAAIAASRHVDNAIRWQDELIEIAEEAERLDLPDGDPLKLRQSRLELLDLKSQQRFAELKLRQELSRLTGRDEAEVARAVMVDPLPTTASSIVAGLAVETAFAQRHDLRAVTILAARLNACNLDAARLLMGIVSPGVGLSLAAASKGLFSCLKEDRSDDDLHDRRRQANNLVESLRHVIRNETLQAVLDVRAASARLTLIDEQIAIAEDRLNRTEGEMKLDDSPPGSDLLIQLQIAELNGKRVGIMKDLALAQDDLDHAQSKPLNE
ncbi:hypothetical protein [Neorhodopirellula pilleata]|uniref:Uncharacterized protein n=1 Tax=Neorhodopirellula pilleata TaxID=2714738 RepID=A0A5C6ASV5_9BACT|nr:hypothetical protein [Neorhodopirellula pilleata]TWU02072.1 hypothetical protein Pla100_18120 [Neorhodopirellula pilleata]